MKPAKNNSALHKKRLIDKAETAFTEARKRGAPRASKYFEDKCTSESGKHSPDGPAV